MTTFGLSYWGRCRETAERDFARAAEVGFSWVCLPCSEERMAFDHAGTKGIVATAKAAGLETHVSPWGICGWFGGEGVVGRRGVDGAMWWLDRAVALDPDGLLWDEPLGVHGPAALELLSLACPLPQHVYLNPKTGVAPDTATLCRMAGIGIDCYGVPWIVAVDRAADLEAEHGKPVHVWVKAHKLAAHESGWPGETVDFLAGCGVRDIGVWGHPAPGMSVLDCAEPHVVWAGVEAAVMACRAGVAA